MQIQKETTRGWIERISGGTTKVIPRDVPKQDSAYYEERARAWHEDIEKSGLEAKLNNDKDINEIAKCLEIASKKEDPALTYAILDVDKMSEINSKYGENVGDLILRQIRKTTTDYLKDKALYVGKPSQETPQSKGDQLILILNHAYLPQDDLDNLIGTIKQNVAIKVYEKLHQDYPSMPARWEALEQEEISVTIGYTAVRNAKIYDQKRGEEKCTTGTELENAAVFLRKNTAFNLNAAKKQTRRLGRGTVFGLN